MFAKRSLAIYAIKIAKVFAVLSIITPPNNSILSFSKLVRRTGRTSAIDIFAFSQLKHFPVQDP